MMSTPQQPELARNKRSPVAAESAKSRAATSLPSNEGSPAPVPEDNRPGHHPEREQDNPTQPDATEPHAQDAATWAERAGGERQAPPAPANQWTEHDGGIEPAPPSGNSTALAARRVAGWLRRTIHRTSRRARR